MQDDETLEIADRNLRFGWAALLVFLSLGLCLEALHGFKVRFYLDSWNETRRLMWTLAHAHGTLLSLVNIAFALTLRSVGFREDRRRWAPVASRLLVAALVLMPLGFLLGGLVVHGGDPGLGVLAVPVGGALLFAGVLLSARGFRR